MCIRFFPISSGLTRRELQGGLVSAETPVGPRELRKRHSSHPSLRRCWNLVDDEKKNDTIFRAGVCRLVGLAAKLSANRRWTRSEPPPLPLERIHWIISRQKQVQIGEIVVAPEEFASHLHRGHA